MLVNGDAPVDFWTEGKELTSLFDNISRRKLEQLGKLIIFFDEIARHNQELLDDSPRS